MKLRHSAGKLAAGGAPCNNSCRSCSWRLAFADDAVSNAAAAVVSGDTGPDWTAVGDSAADPDADSAADPDAEPGADSATDPADDLRVGSATTAATGVCGLLSVETGLTACGEDASCRSLPACWRADETCATFVDDEAGDAF